jgi:hypothetical protein
LDFPERLGKNAKWRFEYVFKETFHIFQLIRRQFMELCFDNSRINGKTRRFKRLHKKSIAIAGEESLFKVSLFRHRL